MYLDTSLFLSVVFASTSLLTAQQFPATPQPKPIPPGKVLSYQKITENVGGFTGPLSPGNGDLHDLFGNSHNVFHICTLIASIIHVWGSFKNFRER